MTWPELLELRRARGVLDVSVENFHEPASPPEGLSLAARRTSVLVQALCAAKRRLGGYV